MNKDKISKELLTRKEIRQQLSDNIILAAKEIQSEKLGLYSKQLMEEGDFSDNIMNKNDLLRPPYNPSKLYEIAENSSILPQCIEAMVHNVDGFGHTLMFNGNAELENSTDALLEKENINNFLKKVNERESFMSVRKSMRRDMETTGNGYIELIRFPTGKIALLYHVDSRYVRLQRIQKNKVEVKTKLFRNGEYQDVTLYKRFRRFALQTSANSNRLKWFKEYGDPRIMDAVTGKYKNELKKGEKIEEIASEIIHFKIGNGPYGLPRWTGSIITAMGLHSADFVNYDLFANQVVPPLVITVSGGVLTTESLRDIQNILVQKRGVENFNKVLILEAQSDGTITDKSTSKIDLKEMSTARKEDSMFVQYTEKGEHRVRGAFRLQPLYIGRADSYSKSTADSAKMIAEEQVFVPERNMFDEFINVCLFDELGVKYWRYESNGPKLISGEHVIEGFKVFSKQGIFTINDGIRLANSLLGTDIVMYDFAWANYPTAIVIKLAELGMLEGIDELIGATDEVAGAINVAASGDADINDPEMAAKLYRAFKILRAKLAAIAGPEHTEEDIEDEINLFNPEK